MSREAASGAGDGHGHTPDKALMLRAPGPWVGHSVALGSVVTVITGRNDSGKTTLLEAIATERANTGWCRTPTGPGSERMKAFEHWIAEAPPKSTWLLEHPDAFVHPLAIRPFVDRLIETALERNVRLVMETHAEAVVQAVRRTVRTRPLHTTQARIVTVERTPIGQRITGIGLDRHGRMIKHPRHPIRPIGKIRHETRQHRRP